MAVTEQQSEGPSVAQIAAFKAEVRSTAETLRVSPAQIRVQVMTRKWGSCSRLGRLSFSRSLLMQSDEFRRYVIVHELLHLRVRNHGRLFRSYLSAYVPGWRSHADLMAMQDARRPLDVSRKPF